MTEHSRNTELLRAELPSHRFEIARYLEWLYDENPYGPAIQRGVDDDGVRVGHYALIPQRFRNPEGIVPAAFSLNAVVRSGGQRKGLFTQMGLEIYEEAQAAGWQLTTGVCNERSIGAVVKYMGWKTPGPLPVRVVFPVHRPGAVTSRTVDAGFLASPAFAQLTDDLDASPVTQWTNSYTPEYLRWRLACPATTFAIHQSDELVAITTTDTRFGVRAAVILKLLPRGGRDGRVTPLRADHLVSAACRFHRAPYAVYAGFNAHVAVGGFRPPRRLQPSPLHLILRSLSPAVDQGPLADRHLRVPRHGRVLSGIR